MGNSDDVALPDQEDEIENERAEPDEMSRADVANGERPEQPKSREQAVYERARTDQHPVGEARAAINREEEPPA